MKKNLSFALCNLLLVHFNTAFFFLVNEVPIIVGTPPIPPLLPHPLNIPKVESLGGGVGSKVFARKGG